MNLRKALTLLPLLVSSIASAGTFTEADLVFGAFEQDHFLQKPNAVEDSRNENFMGASASIYANLSSGILKARGVSPPPPLNTFYVSSALAHAQFFDHLTFAQGTSGTAYLDFHVDGFFTNPSASFTSVATLGLYAVSPKTNGAISESHVLTTGPSCGGFSTPFCIAGTSEDVYGSLAIPLGAGDLFIQTDLIVTAGNGAAGDFSNTSKFFLRVPNGVSYTSGSGQFLATAAPVFPPGQTVPEPESLALLGLGFFGLAASRRKSRNNKN